MTLRHLALKTSKILAHVDANAGWITISNPERRNAISLEMWRGLGDATLAFQADPEVRVVVMDKRKPVFTGT